MENKKRVCFVTNTLFSVGGVQRVLAVVATKLTEQYEVTIITLEDSPNCDQTIYNLDKTTIKYNFYRFPTIPEWDKKAHRIISGLYKKYLPKNRITSEVYARSSFPKAMRNAFVKTLNDGQYDVIIGVHGGISMKLATIRKQLNAKKVIGWMHNCYNAFFDNKPAYYEGLKDHFKWQMQKLDNVVVLSHADAKLFQENMELNPTVIYNPLTLTPGKPCNLVAKKFLAIGRMVPLHKGFDILIDAFALFAHKNKEWTLDIVGEGPEKEKLIEQINYHKLENRITIHPFTNQIQDYYSSASVYVLSSRWEGMPLVLAEAMAHGLPIISSDIPICKEILMNQSFSHLFPSGNIEKLAEYLLVVSSQDLRPQIQASLDYSEKFRDFSEWNKILS